MFVAYLAYLKTASRLVPGITEGYRENYDRRQNLPNTKEKCKALDPCKIRHLVFVQEQTAELKPCTL
jgi:hypothetical protein